MDSVSFINPLWFVIIFSLFYLFIIFPALNLASVRAVGVSGVCCWNMVLLDIERMNELIL